MTIIEEMMNVKDRDTNTEKIDNCGCGCSAEEVNARESKPLAEKSRK